MVVAVATSDGELIDRDFTTAGERRRAVVQRKLSRAAKGSATKIRGELGKLRAAERHRREDFCVKAAAVGAHQRGGGARRPQNPQHDPPGPGGRGSRQCRPVPCERGVQQIGLEQGNPGQGVVSVRASVDVCVPLHRDAGGQSPGSIYVVTVFGVWACGPEIS